MHALKFVGGFLEIEQLPFIVLIKVNELVTAVCDTVVAGDTVGAGEFIVVIVKMGAPVLWCLALEQRHEAGALHVRRSLGTGKLKKGLGKVEI